MNDYGMALGQRKTEICNSPINPELVRAVKERVKQEQGAALVQLLL